MIGAGWLCLRDFITSGKSGFNLIGNNINTVFRLPNESMLDIRLAETAKMWIWAVPCLFLFAALGRLRRGDDQHVRLLTQSAVVTFVGYLFFYLRPGTRVGISLFSFGLGE